MPGDNCAFNQCGTSRRSKGIGLFKLPTPRRSDDVETKEWREKVLAVLKKYRVEDEGFKRQLAANTLHICEKHFRPEDIEIYEGEKMTKRFLKKGVLPSLNMPVKSFHFTKTNCVKREPRTVVQSIPIEDKQHFYYKSLLELKKRVGKLVLKDWCVAETDNEDYFTLNHMDSESLVPKLSVMIDESLSFTISVFGYFIPGSHFLYEDFRRSVRNVTVSDLLLNLHSLMICSGSTSLGDEGTVRHVVPILVNPFEGDSVNSPFPCKEYIRAKSCLVLIKSDDVGGCMCNSCSDLGLKQEKKKRKSRAKLSVPAQAKAPIKGTSVERIRLALQESRLQNKQLLKELGKMKVEIEMNSKSLDHELDKDLLSIIDKHSQKMTPFMKLFWEQQKKISDRPSFGRRYHPMIIRWCLSISSKSASAYEELRETFKDGGLLELPSKRMLQNYRNAVSPKCGFNPDVIADLIDASRDYQGLQRYIVLLVDEMKVQDNLVWNKHSGKLVGFVDLGDPDTNFATLKETDALATHMLVFMIRGIQTRLKMSMAYFATTAVTGHQMFPIFWKAVGLLEMTCKLAIIAVICDGASSNRNFFKMHEDLDGRGSANIVHRTLNLFAKDRYIYFFSDPPHLVKTSRNCLHNSGSGRGSRLMWNNGCYLLWSHISTLYYNDLENGLHFLPKLTTEHVELTSFSVMKVNLAAQVLSQTVANILRDFGPPDAAATAEFCEHIDSFFDCMNVRSLKEGYGKRKPYLLPYRSLEDERLTWLKETFLKYLETWKSSIERREGTFSEADKAKMFISKQTHEGFMITVHSLIETVRFLLSSGMEYVLSNRFCQDPLEEYFGKQRGIGRRNENPTVKDFGYNDNIIRVQRSVLQIKGNVTSTKKSSEKRWKETTDEPLLTKETIKKRKLDS